MIDNIKITHQDKTLPIMYWSSEICKTPIGATFIVALKKQIAKPLLDVVSKDFKMIFNHVENFHIKIILHML